MTERRAREAGFPVNTGRFAYFNLTRFIIADEMEGFIKVVADEDTGRILGSHIIGILASETSVCGSRGLARMAPVVVCWVQQGREECSMAAEESKVPDGSPCPQANMFV